MSGDREATSEQSSSVHKGAGYNEVYPSVHGPEEGLSWSSKREPFAHSPDDKEDFDREGVEENDEYDYGEGVNKEEYEGKGDEEKGENEEEYEGEGDEGEDEVDGRAYEEGSLGSFGDGHTRPFILSTIWTVNDFKPIMTTNIFKTLRDRYQIPDNIPIRLLGKFEKCYSGKIANVGMYDIMFTIGLRLPLTTLHCQLATFLGLYVSQVAPNAWRIFIGTKIL